MRIVNVHEAKTTLSSLLAAVERGEEVVIARDGKPVAKLSRLGAVARTPGAWRSDPAWADFEFDPSIFAPLTEEEMRSEGWV
jgi:antitoxin (DNA-binding transcriptional repressor) of toxin-antitoxin stability system